MAGTHNVNDIRVGYHPNGYRIDKTASPLNFYTKWEIDANGGWGNPVPVFFDSLPQDGWVKVGEERDGAENER